MLLLISLRSANERSSTAREESVKGLSIGAVKWFRVGGLGCLLIVVYVREETREPLAN